MNTDRLPARILPLLYFGTAHLSLALASVLVAWSPRSVAGFFYHSWMVAIVHLVTLGWITLSILGAIYVVGPVALGLPLPARRADYWAYAFALVGIIGMIAHFWIAEFGGMAWSAATVTCGILYVASRVVGGLTQASLPAAVKLHVVFACVNISLAAAIGILLGFDKVYHFLPGFILSNVFAHAHLAALGWATMMVVGVGYRLLPMTLPSKAPKGPTLFASAILLETGVLGLVVSLFMRSPWARLFGVIIVAGLGAFGAHVVRMVRSPAPKPVGAPRVDFAVLHAVSAGLSLGAAVLIGLVLLFAPMSEQTLRAAAAYGVFGLLGFLAQMIIAMETRILPWLTWYWAYARTDFSTPPTPPLAMSDRTLQALTFVCWTLAVPALAGGFLWEAPRLLGAGAWALLVAVLSATLNHLLVLSHVRRSPESSPVQSFLSPSRFQIRRTMAGGHPGGGNADRRS